MKLSKTNVHNALARGIERIRLLEGHTPEEFASSLNIPLKTYMTWVSENGTGPKPSIEAIQIIIDKTGRPLHDFLPKLMLIDQALIHLCEAIGIGINKDDVSINNIGKIVQQVFVLRDNKKFLDELSELIKSAENDDESPNNK